MDLHRRDFFKFMGATGLTLAVGKELKAAPKVKKEKKEKNEHKGHKGKHGDSQGSHSKNRD